MDLLEFLVSTFVAAVIRWYKDPLRKVPGPTGVPLLGNILELDPTTMHMQLYRLAMKFGPVMKIRLYTQPYVVLNMPEVCQEALVTRGNDFQGRPPLYRMTFLAETDLALLTVDHPSYLTQRKLTTKALRSYGEGITHLEKIVLETIQDVLDRLCSEKARAVDAHAVTHGFTTCVMAEVIFGEQLSYDDPICASLDHMNQRILLSGDPISMGSLMDIYPILSNIPWFFPSTFKDLKDTKRECEEFFATRLKEAKESYDESNLRGCLDVFIQHQRETPSYPNECLKGILMDFVIGGIDTSTSLLDQAVLELVADKTLQKKLQREIDAVIGSAGTPHSANRDQMPLLESFILETLRYLSQVPLFVPRYTICDTEVGGYKIPAHTRVLINSFFAAHDPDAYENPFEFKAERFIGEDGAIVPKGHPLRRSFFGFGAGRRVCPGEHFAKSRAFLFLASILQQFDLEADGPVPEKDVRKYKMGIIIHPPHCMVRFIPRTH